MDSWLGATLLVLGFIVLCRAFRLVARAHGVFEESGAALAVMGDPTLDDDSKERAMQRHAIRLFGLFLRLVLGGAFALVAPLGALWVADRFGWLSWHATLEASFSIPFLLIVTVGSLLGWFIWRRFRTEPADQLETSSDYSAADRLLHRTAFATIPVQIAVSSLEDRLYRTRLSAIDLNRPVFVTGLPRSGTTLLLELCHHTGEFVAHTYRQMPFVINPLLWHAFARHFRKDAEARERAHGDGMMIGSDSPEALEEILWMAFWKPHYGRSSITPWTPDEQARGFLHFYQRHMAKIAAVSSASETNRKRYLSKNNLNIARIGWLRNAFPDARIVIPFRDPRQHAASLLRQHGNFLARHRHDPFVREYMAAIGHFDFGANLRPIDFDHWLDTAPTSDAQSLNFWLAYWTAAYRALQREANFSRAFLLDFDALCANPDTGLELLADILELATPEKLTSQASRLRSPTQHPIDEEQVDPAILEEALRLYDSLRQKTPAARPG